MLSIDPTIQGKTGKMKLTKQRLRQIIKEELSTVRESDWYDDENETRGDRKYRDTMSVGADIEGYPEPEEDEDPMASRLGTREEQLLSRILARAVVDRYDSLEDLADDLGIEITRDMARFIGSLKANPMYGSSRRGLQEDPDDWRDAQIEDAQQSGALDGSSGREKVGGYGYFQRYYDAAYDKAVEKNEDL